MNALIHTLRDRAAKYAAYRRTVAELEAMPLEVAIDLGMFREDARKVAARAVYGA